MPRGWPTSAGTVAASGVDDLHGGARRHGIAFQQPHDVVLALVDQRLVRLVHRAQRVER